MGHLWTRETLMRRIDRCYLLAAGARRPEKRNLHLELARHYRTILSAVHEGVVRTSIEFRRIHAQAGGRLSAA